MSDVILKRLGDIVNFKRGYDLPLNQREDGVYPVISSSGITGYHSKYKKKGIALITGRYGTLGEMYYYEGAYWPHNTTLYATTFFDNHPKYVYYLLKCLGNLKTSDKSTVPGINRNDLHEISIPFIENKLKQKSIAKVLSDLDAKIELNNKINQELEAMAKLLYDYWFVQFDFPNEQGKPYKSSGGKMGYNKDLKREIPEGWKVKTLGSEVEIQRGISYTSKEINGEGIPMINLNSFNLDGTYKPEGVKTYSGKYTEKNILESGNLLIAATDVTRNADIIGRAILVPDYYNEDLVFSMDIAKIISKNIPSSFLMMLFNSNHYHNYIKWHASGTLVLHLNLDGLKWYRTEIPPTDLMGRFNSFYLPISKRINDSVKQNQQLSKFRDWLLPMLMNGQVTVGEAEEKLNMAAEPQSEYGKVVNANFTERECNTSERAILAAYIVKMVGHNEIGKTKLMKLLHLTEYICRIKLGSHFVKQTAGPYDEAMINDIHRVFQQYNLFKVETTKKGSFSEVHYIPSFEFGQIEERFLEIYSNEVVRVNDLLNRMKGWKLKHCEILSTLYAVWNNRIKRNQSTEKHLLKKDFFEWSNRKKRIFTESEVDKSIEWMKRKNIVPTGWGDFVEEIA